MPKKPNPIDAQVGNRVRTRRRILGLSQTVLGERVGLSFQQIQKYEKGTNRIGASRLQQISEILEAPISYFFGEPSSAEPGSARRSETSLAHVTEFLATSDGLALTRSFMSIKDRKVRRRVVELVKQIAGKRTVGLDAR